MIEAHVQFNGGGYSVYKTYQPTLKCEFDDHSTCKQASERFQAEEDAKTAEVRDAEAATRQAEIAAAAVTAEADAKKAETDAAGQKKFEATRIVNRDAAAKLENLSQAHAENIGKINAKAAADVEEAGKFYDEAAAEIVKTQKTGIDAINAKDWLSELRATKDAA